MRLSKQCEAPKAVFLAGILLATIPSVTVSAMCRRFNTGLMLAAGSTGEVFWYNGGDVTAACKYS